MNVQKKTLNCFRAVMAIFIIMGFFVPAYGTVTAEEIVYSNVGESDKGVREVYVRDGGDYYYGAIDEESNVIIAPTGDSVYVSNRNGYVVTSRAGKIYSRPGFVLADQTQVIRAENNERLDFDKYLTYYDGSRGIALTNINGAYKYALVNQTGSPLTDFEYDSLEVLADSGSAQTFLAKKGEFYGLLNWDGAVVLPFEYRSVRNYAGSNDAYLGVAMNNGWNEGMFSRATGQIVIQPVYPFVGGFYDGFCAVGNEDGKAAFFNISGESVTGFIFDGAQHYSEGLAAVSVGGKWGYIDMNQQMAVSPAYDSAGAFRNGYAEVSVGENREIIESPVLQRRKDEINVYLNNAWIFSEEVPYILSNRTMLPIRAVSESLGFGVKWYPSERKIVIQNANRVLRFAVGSTEASVNVFDDGLSADKVILDAAPEIRMGRAYVPIRFIAENLGYGVEWESASHSVYIKSLPKTE
jgi:hypothetical protein